MNKDNEVYEFIIKKNTKKGLYAVVLNDNTHVIMSMKDHSILLGLPKDKFYKIFTEQMKRKGKYLLLQFPYEEIVAINRGVDLLFPKRKGGKNVGHKKTIRKKRR